MMYEIFIFLFQAKIVMEMNPLMRLMQKEHELTVKIFLQLEIWLVEATEAIPWKNT